MSFVNIYGQYIFGNSFIESNITNRVVEYINILNPLSIQLISPSIITESPKKILNQNHDFSNYTGSINDDIEDIIYWWNLRSYSGDAKYEIVSDTPNNLLNQSLKYTNITQPDNYYDHRIRQVDFYEGYKKPLKLSFWGKSSINYALPIRDVDSLDGGTCIIEPLTPNWTYFETYFTGTFKSTDLAFYLGNIPESQSIYLSDVQLTENASPFYITMKSSVEQNQIIAWDNLTENYDFENYTGSIDDNISDTVDWWNLRAYSGEAKYEVVSDSPIGFKRSLKYTNISLPDNYYDHRIRKSNFYEGYNRPLTLEFWAKSTVDFIMPVHDSDNNDGICFVVSLIPEWRKYSISFVGNENASDLNFYLGWIPEGESIYLTDIRLYDKLSPYDVDLISKIYSGQLVDSIDITQPTIKYSFQEDKIQEDILINEPTPIENINVPVFQESINIFNLNEFVSTIYSDLLEDSIETLNSTEISKLYSGITIDTLEVYTPGSSNKINSSLIYDPIRIFNPTINTGLYEVFTDIGGPGWYEDDILIAQKYDFDKTGSLLEIYNLTGTVESIDADGKYSIQINGTRDDWDKFENHTSEIEFVKWGNKTNTNRQANIVMSSILPGGPFIDILNGVNDPTDLNKISYLKARLGNLNSIIDSDFGQLDDYGLYTTNAYLKGGVVANTGSIGGWYIDSTSIRSKNNKISLNDVGEISSSNFYLREDGQVIITGSLDIQNLGDINITSLNDDGGWGTQIFANSSSISLNASDILGNSSSISVNSTDIELVSTGTITLNGNTTVEGTFGITWGTNIDNMPGGADRLQDSPTGTGIYMTAIDIGFYDSNYTGGGVGGWPIRIWNDSGTGKFKLQNNSNDNEFSWDGSSIYIYTPKFFFGQNSTTFISGSNGNIEIKDSNFHLVDGSITATNVDLSGKISADSGDIGGWEIGSTYLQSKADGNARIKLDDTEDRITVIDSSNITKVAMGYLDGLEKNNAAGTWGPGDYGFWVKESDSMVIDGDVEYKNGDWLIENDASVKIENGSGYSLLVMGTDDGTTEKGFFTYDGTVSENIVNAIRTDGSGQLANGNVEWDISGNITASNALFDSGDFTGNISSDATITGGTIKHTSDYWKFNSDGSGILANGNVEWDTDGNFTASNALFDNGDFTGNITSDATITGGTFQTDTGTGQRVIIDGSNNKITFYDSSNNDINLYGFSNYLYIDNKLYTEKVQVSPTGYFRIETSPGEIFDIKGHTSGGLLNGEGFEIEGETILNGNTVITGSLGISQNIDINGSLTKGSGTFKIKNPIPNTNDYLYHSFVESPTEGDNIYRYKKYIEKKLTFNLPNYFQYLNKNSQVWITSVDSFGNGYGKIKNNKINITVNKSGWYNILIIGTRKDKIATKNWKGTVREN